MGNRLAGESRGSYTARAAALTFGPMAGVLSPGSVFCKQPVFLMPKKAAANPGDTTPKPAKSSPASKSAKAKPEVPDALTAIPATKPAPEVAPRPIPPVKVSRRVKAKAAEAAEKVSEAVTKAKAPVKAAVEKAKAPVKAAVEKAKAPVKQAVAKAKAPAKKKVAEVKATAESTGKKVAARALHKVAEAIQKVTEVVKKLPTFGHNDIAVRAYGIYQRRAREGRHGTPMGDWLEAERQLKAEQAE